ILEAAGDFITARLTDNLAAITSSGSDHFSAQVNRPDTGALVTLTDYSVAADNLTVFVGARTLSGELGFGGPNAYSASGSSAFIKTVSERGQGSPTSGSAATEFAPWGGQITFSSNATWYFDNDLSTTESFSGNDFYSIALHELAHVLGVGTSASWQNKIVNGNFTGAAAVAVYGGAVPLSDSGHWLSGTQSTVMGVPQEAAMDPEITVGSRKVLTKLDFAGLQDIGWQVTPVPVPSAVWLFGSALLGFLGLKRKNRISA
ncbi:MAG: matrixin family metalloprotease, partial [Methylococcales bacterium]